MSRALENTAFSKYLFCHIGPIKAAYDFLCERCGSEGRLAEATPVQRSIYVSLDVVGWWMACTPVGAPNREDCEKMAIGIATGQVTKDDYTPLGIIGQSGVSKRGRTRGKACTRSTSGEGLDRQHQDDRREDRPPAEDDGPEH